MRTKTTLIAAAVVGLAGLASAIAEVYSVNAVGFVNRAFPPGFSINANPLNNGDNKLSTLIPTPPANSVVYKWDTTLNPPDYVSSTYKFGKWTNPDIVLKPGDGFWFKNPGASDFSLTFVGEVPQSSTPTTTDLNVGLVAGFNLVSSVVPQSLVLRDPANLTSPPPPAPTPDLGFPVAANDTVYFYRDIGGGTRDYVVYTFKFGKWVKSGDSSDTAGPIPGVGEGFWLKTGAAKTWSRAFSVNQ